ncbi:MAG: hypothetical protein ACKPHU_21520, partial [Planctomycetaceae bacterium]
YAGPWFQVRASSRLRLGFVGNGYGSTRFDTEEFLIWNRALTAAEVLAASLRLGGNSHPQQQLIQAAQDMQAGKSEQAIGSLEALSDGQVPDGLQQAAVFLLAENQRRSGQSAT